MTFALSCSSLNCAVRSVRIVEVRLRAFGCRVSNAQVLAVEDDLRGCRAAYHDSCLIGQVPALPLGKEGENPASPGFL